MALALTRLQRLLRRLRKSNRLFIVGGSNPSVRAKKNKGGFSKWRARKDGIGADAPAAIAPQAPQVEPIVHRRRLEPFRARKKKTRHKGGFSKWRARKDSNLRPPGS
jgi:hypothetical protein